MNTDGTRPSSGAPTPVPNRWVSVDVGTKNLAYCVMDADEPHVIYEWNVISLYDEPHSAGPEERRREPRKKEEREQKRALGLVEIGVQLARWFDYLQMNRGEKRVCGVVIENQIAPIASNMKSIQCMIAQYFITNGITCVHFLSAANKLKGFIGNGNKGCLSYKERKALAVACCRDLLQKNAQLSPWLAYMDAHKKKDDLADAYMQGVSFFSTRAKAASNCGQVQP